MPEDDLAYDGSNEPQLRALTARERDILTCLLTEELHRMSRPLRPDASPLMQLVRWPYEDLRTMRHVLDPRRGH